MTVYERRETVVRTVEHAIRSGSNMADFHKLLHTARADYCRRTGHNPQDAAPDHWARIEAQDDEVVIAFTVDEKPDAAEQRLNRARVVHRELLLALTTNAGHGRDGHLNEDDLNRIRRALDGEA